MNSVAPNQGKATTIRKTFSRETSVSTTIQADAGIVWALLTNASDYPRWNSTVVSIKGEIDRVADGTWPADDNPLRNAPHTAEDLLGAWDRPYDRQLGAFPVPGLRRSQYFPPVSRIDAAYGDRNLVCSCAPLETYVASSPD